jgi:hypothetical protein
MWDFAYVQPKSLKNDLRVDDESAGAKLLAWIMIFFQN